MLNENYLFLITLDVISVRQQVSKSVYDQGITLKPCRAQCVTYSFTLMQSGHENRNINGCTLFKIKLTLLQ